MGARTIADRQITGCGALPPELACPTAPFFAELARLGMVVEKGIVETGELA